MIAVFAHSSSTVGDGPLIVQLQRVHQHLLVNEAGFIASSLIALFAVPLMLALASGPVGRSWLPYRSFG